ncbi:hypothetical protein EXN66_Car003963 [Channa argus]|uniref:Uncharacterized protein n=1 Tax=Channa argus TaxID=215402 RepID=A0A6G1PDA8_CHAAH|nr:hypothetical protein EXN66_Car003963 [Channa argus]
MTVSPGQVESGISSAGLSERHSVSMQLKDKQRTRVLILLFLSFCQSHLYREA